MNGKKVGFKRPGGTAASSVAAADQFVNQGRDGGGNIVPMERPAAPRQMVRFTLDVDADLHTRMKVKCALEGKKMADVLRAVLEREFPVA